jgi:hypothetical protein
MEPALAYSRAYHWLRGRRYVDEILLRQFNDIWEGEGSLLDKTAATFVLGDRKAAELFADIRPPCWIPTTLPPPLADRSLPQYYRANLALAYAKELCARRAFEEASDALLAGGSEGVVDPALYFFLKAQAAYSLMLRRQAQEAIEELLDVTDVPERYRVLALCMQADMETWVDKDLRWVARKMSNAARRLELGRVDAQTQKMQKEILVRLDEIIKETTWAAGVTETAEPHCPKD